MDRLSRSLLSIRKTNARNPPISSPWKQQPCPSWARFTTTTAETQKKTAIIISASSVTNDQSGESTIINAAAHGTSYFTPAQDPPAGTALYLSESTPKLFQPLKLRGLTLQNRIMVSPMCQYSAQNGHQTNWHLAHLGALLMRGPGLLMVEATAVEARGRTTPEDCGLWCDAQIKPLRALTEFAHSQGQNMGIQLAHAGRKGSMVAPWLAFPPAIAVEAAGGWPGDVVGPSSIPWSAQHPSVHALDGDGIQQVRAQWKASVRRAVQAGFDIIEIHAAHGYLLHSFCSPISNQRNDEFGGSFENRIRLLRCVVADARQVMPRQMPLSLRISGSDRLEERSDLESWTLQDSLRLAPQLADLGVDLIDVSYGGTHLEQKPLIGPANQAGLALAIKKAVGTGVAIATVGNLNDARTAQEVIEQGLDVAAVGRAFLNDPNLVSTWANDLDVPIAVSRQIGWSLPRK